MDAVILVVNLSDLCVPAIPLNGGASCAINGANFGR